MSIVIVLILILLGLLGVDMAETADCDSGSAGCVTTVVASEWEFVETEGVSGVIVAESDGSRFLSADAYWTPSISDITGVERAIATDQGDLVHRRQYVGFVEQGDRKIFINGFADDVGIAWMTEPVLVEDGGEAFFEAVFNVETGELERFTFNGEA